VVDQVSIPVYWQLGGIADGTWSSQLLWLLGCFCSSASTRIYVGLLYSVHAHRTLKILILKAKDID